MEPLVKLVMDSTLDHAWSALPHAPMVPEPPPRRRPDLRPVRRSAAAALRRFADTVEPRVASDCG
jgi:hypothetical protein